MTIDLIVTYISAGSVGPSHAWCSFVVVALLRRRAMDPVTPTTVRNAPLRKHPGPHTGSHIDSCSIGSVGISATAVSADTATAITALVTANDGSSTTRASLRATHYLLDSVVADLSVAVENLAASERRAVTRTWLLRWLPSHGTS